MAGLARHELCTMFAGRALKDRVSTDRLMNLDPSDKRPVEVVLDLEWLSRERPHLAWYEPRRRDMWRFGGLCRWTLRTVRIDHISSHLGKAIRRCVNMRITRWRERSGSGSK